MVASRSWMIALALALLACGAETRSEPVVDTVVTPPRADLEAIGRELVTMASQDARAHETIRDDPFDDRAIETATEVRRRNTERLQSIVAAIGWPSVSKVGVDAAESAWLIAQHADQVPEFQRECLDLLSAAHEAGDVPGWQFAYLSDRVRVNAREATLYGTQGGHGYTPEQEAEIDDRRRALGMETLAEFRANAGRRSSSP